jgi:hypothetical protein
MKITDVKLLVLEDPEAKGRGGHSIVRVEGLDSVYAAREQERRAAAGEFSRGACGRRD